MLAPQLLDSTFTLAHGSHQQVKLEGTYEWSCLCCLVVSKTAANAV